LARTIYGQRTRILKNAQRSAGILLAISVIAKKGSEHRQFFQRADKMSALLFKLFLR
jgi:hypothetical protein